MNGEFIADSYGNMKFRAIDDNGYVIPNQYLDSNMPHSTIDGQPEYYQSQQFNTQFYPRIQAEKLQAANIIAPPG